jgi:hypothetical protein
MSGTIYARDTLTGKLLWIYPGNHTYLGDPWPLMPIYISPIADGKIYTFTFEHSASEPLRKGARVYCINATTGQEIWDLMGWPSSYSHSRKGGLVADGYLAYFNAYDNQIYSIGKGPSATTVTASPKVSVHGNSVLLEGTVTDTAAGTEQQEQAARFPNGVPAVSDASIGAWMEYVYMQKPKPTNAIGVPVTLTALDPNGNTENIGTATSDDMGNFAIAWTPPVPGVYKIKATFAGSNSYFTSSAETAIDVSTAPAAQAPIATPASSATSPPAATPSPSPQVTETPIPPPSSAGIPTTYIIIAVVAIIVVVAAAALALRRRK